MADTLAKECKEATAILSVESSRLILFDYEVRELPAARQKVLDELLKKVNDRKEENVPKNKSK